VRARAPCGLALAGYDVRGSRPPSAGFGRVRCFSERDACSCGRHDDRKHMCDMFERSFRRGKSGVSTRGPADGSTERASGRRTVSGGGRTAGRTMTSRPVLYLFTRPPSAFRKVDAFISDKKKDVCGVVISVHVCHRQSGRNARHDTAPPCIALHCDVADTPWPCPQASRPHSFAASVRPSVARLVVHWPGWARLAASLFAGQPRSSQRRASERRRDRSLCIVYCETTRLGHVTRHVSHAQHSRAQHPLQPYRSSTTSTPICLPSRSEARTGPLTPNVLESEPASPWKNAYPCSTSLLTRQDGFR